MNNSSSEQTVAEPAARKRWEEPCIVLERSLEVSAQGGPPGGAPPVPEITVSELRDRMQAEMRKPPMTQAEREETDALEELDDELVYDLEKWIDILEDVKTAITGGRLSRHTDLPNPAKSKDKRAFN